VSDWISVKQELPQDGTNVLVFTNYWSSYPFVAYIERGEWHGHRILSRPDAVTHWMPLPAPPEATHED
jgi:hypothetical protein